MPDCTESAPGIAVEEVIEGAVLLHDDDNMLDGRAVLGGDDGGLGGGRAREGAAASAACGGDKEGRGDTQHGYGTEAMLRHGRGLKVLIGCAAAVLQSFCSGLTDGTPPPLFCAKSSNERL